MWNNYNTLPRNYKNRFSIHSAIHNQRVYGLKGTEHVGNDPKKLYKIEKCYIFIQLDVKCNLEKCGIVIS